MPKRFTFQTQSSSASGKVIRHLLLFSACSASLAAIMFGFEMHDPIHHMLEEGEKYGLDLVFFALLGGLLLFLGLQTFDLVRQVKHRRNAEKIALELSLTDPLTSLGNRRKLEEELQKRKPGCGCAIIMIDLNDFKPVNDVFGHAAGDALLQEIAKRVMHAAPNDSIVCRIGGDEFAILTASAIDEEALHILARTLSVSISTPIIVGKNDFRISGSIGISTMVHMDRSGEVVLREADLALYRSKENRNLPFCVFEKHMEASAYRRTHMEAKLRKAVDQNLVQPHFQPLVDLKTSELIGFEALARWHDPEFGHVPPNEFISLAEQAGLINQLSESLLRQACTEAMKWPKHLTLSFNLSPRQLRDPQLGLRIVSILGATGLAPQRLEVEITESSLVEDAALAKTILSSLRSAGVRIAIDDFGTGYSSLYHLKEFKFDNLKIDRSFVSPLGSDSDNDVIFNAILTMSRGLGLSTVAEGIESEQQLETLLKSGCQIGQGYLFGKAISGEAVLKLIEDSTVHPEKATG